MALVTGDDYEDLVEWIKTIATDAAIEAITKMLGKGEDMDWLAGTIGEATATGFEQLLVNQYGDS